jgi:hypothetical protein
MQRISNCCTPSRRSAAYSAAGLALLVLLLLLRAASAQLAGENLLVAMPPGYKIGYRVERGNMVMNEMVPAGQTVDDWSEMVTVQIFHGLKAPPEKFRDALQQRWIAACPGGSGANVLSGSENGYPVLVWLLDCPKNPQSGKPEITWFKAIAGNDSFYLVQKAFKFKPDKQQVDRWMAYLKSIAVCDKRIAARACPQTGK